MTDLLPKPSVCWVDAAVIANFECCTLPLLYAADDECKMYFQAMKKKNPRKGILLEAVYALTLEARDAKAAGDYLACVRKLKEGVERRVEIFLPSDYQVVASLEHCVWAAIHLGVLVMSSSSSQGASCSTTLFRFGADTLREFESRIPSDPFIKHLLEFALHYNWTNYFVGREKWHAAKHHGTLALSRWSMLTSRTSVDDVVGRFLVVRVAVADERLGESLPAVASTLSSLSSESPTDGQNNLVLQLSSGEEVRELTFCFGASRPATMWSGSIHSATEAMRCFALAMCQHSMRRYENALATLGSGATNLTGNQTWLKTSVPLLERLCMTKSKLDTLRDTVRPMSKAMTRSDGLVVQRILKKYLLSRRAAKERHIREQERKRQVLDDGVDGDADPQVTEQKWRLEPSITELEGRLFTSPEPGSVLSGFAHVVPMFERGVRPHDAVKKLEQAHVLPMSPQDAVRAVLQTRARAGNSPKPVTDVSAKLELTDDTIAFSTQKKGRKTSSPCPRAERPPMQKSTISPDVARIFSPPVGHRRIRHDGADVTTSPVERPLSSSSRHSTLSETDRAEVLNQVVEEFVLRESEREIHRRTYGARSKAVSLRACASALLELANVVEEQAKSVDRMVSLSEVTRADTANHAICGDRASENIEKEPNCQEREAAPVSIPRRNVERLSSGGTNCAVMEPQMVHDSVTTLNDAQRRLRALLPSIDHHSTAYRMVVAELAENERRLQHHRNVRHVRALARSAETAAEKSALSVRKGYIVPNLSDLPASDAPPAVPVDMLAVHALATMTDLLFCAVVD